MRNCILLLFLLVCTSLSAQELSVKSFKEASNDLSARTQARQDNNGEDCALVKVQVEIPNVKFSGMIVGDVQNHPNEYWIYMAKGSKRLTIRVEGYLPLEVSFGDYGINTLKSQCVYKLMIMEIRII